MIINIKNNKIIFKNKTSRQEYISCELENCGCRVNTFIWVSHELKAIYFETPKAACSSIKKALQIKVTNFDIKNAFIHFQTQDSNIKICKKTKQILENIEKEKENKLFFMFQGTPDKALELYPDYFSFMFVRDPFSRVKSLWQMFCKSNLPFREKQFQSMFQKNPKNVNFEEFTELIQIECNHHWNQYSIFLPDSGKIDFIGKLESLSNDWKYINSKMGVSLELPHENKSKKSEAVMTEKAIENINKIFREDYSKFDYKKRSK